MSVIERLPRFACPDWWEKLNRGETPMASVPVNEARAARALAFFNRLRLPDVPGHPTMAEACGDWFRDVLVAFLASEDQQSRERIVWEALLEVPKKNSKSTYTSGLALTALYMEEAPNRQMLLLGPTQNISERCFDQAQGMIRLDDKLKAIFRIQDHLKTITRFKTGTKLEVMTFDPKIVTGEIPVMTIIDELHELGDKSGAQNVMQQIRGGGITMQGGQLFMITTQSPRPPSGVWRTELAKARAIRDGKGGRAPIMLPVLYEFPEQVQRDEAFWKDRRNWKLVLPNLGKSISRQRLEDDYENNGRVTREAETIWLSQHLNIEVGIGLNADPWIAAEYWPKARREGGLSLEQLIAACDVAVMGIDGGGMDDLLGMAVIGRDRISRTWLCWAHAWAHPIALERRKENEPALRGFEVDGDLTICERPTQDLVEVAEYAGILKDAGLLPASAAIGLDPAGVAALVDELAAAGIEPAQMVGVPQGYRLAPAIWGMERKLTDGTFRHGGQGLMAWAVGNARAEQKGNAVMITKEVAGKAKIDPLIAAFNAFMLMSRNPAAGRKASYLDNNDLMVLS
jgi:phage terminase large subunit-like protein